MSTSHQLACAHAHRLKTQLDSKSYQDFQGAKAAEWKFDE